ncbi:uncharacterized protein BP5553_01427 [Venustampulla echinocandica]|uniref:Sphingoid long-chain base transporter RSB1 n=1 Tax=Venustampulla echinocandica TaxID=2656787 RepID=A0A370U106_9HELO|nr:uncharacterized protein BP5553_01427 [Venustampulla echinocandica]RDL41448.1 hypothetical protein BP5553_01427 [Venustampulla echinocandica]
MASLVSSAIQLVGRGTLRDKYAECTLDTCPLWTSYYFYRVNLAANATFISLFAISLIGFVVTFALTRRANAFSAAMISGTVLEVLGYYGRIASWKNQWAETGFLMQIFIPCDLLSLLLQAAGGGIASSASHSGHDPTVGNNIMIAGLAFQVATLFTFMGFCIDFTIRTRKRYKSMGEQAFDQNPLFIELRRSLKFKGFLAALTLATICIFWRSVYRVAELAEGWTGHLIKQQWLFVGFEGVMVIVACLALNAFNPAYTFKEAMEGLGGLGSKKKAKKQETRSPSSSDVEGVKTENA